MSVLQLKETLFKLPSAGLGIFEPGNIKIRATTAGDQRYFSVNPDNSYHSYLTYLDRVVVEPKPAKLDNLLVDDLNAIVYGVRILTHGNEYPMPFICSNCGDWKLGILDLRTLNVTYADEVTDFKSVDIETKVGDQEVTFHLKTLKDEKAIENQMNYLKKTNKIVNEKLDRQFVNYAQLIDFIDGKDTPFINKFEFLTQLTEDQFVDLVVTINSKAIGLPSMVNITCPDCDLEQEATLVVTPNFFRTFKRDN